MPPDSSALRVVVDTNVLFSALAFPKDSPPLRVVELAQAGRLVLIASPFILAELETALRERASWDEERLLVLRKKLKTFLRLVEPTIRLHVIKRIEADNRILECAVAANADVLVTGNMKDIRPLGSFHGIDILTPREFLTIHFPSLRP